MKDNRVNENKAARPACSAGGGASNMAAKLQDQVISCSLEKIQHKILVMSGKGGVGKSSISSNLAAGLAKRSYKVGLLDVDLHGPSIANMMGVEGLLDINEDRFVTPKSIGENLKVISMQSLMQDKDQAVIWRGPAKNGVIRQFIADVNWGELDFLIVDSPPGTGDEPLTVSQTIADAKALVVTTPQDVALADVRKSINFCRIVNLEILGLVENMGPFDCPCCGKTVELFKSMGGEKLAKEMGLPLLGSIPFDPKVVSNCDKGRPIVLENSESQFATAMDKIIDNILRSLVG